jgi:hypothetical protein
MLLVWSESFDAVHILPFVQPVHYLPDFVKYVIAHLFVLNFIENDGYESPHEF